MLNKSNKEMEVDFNDIFNCLWIIIKRNRNCIPSDDDDDVSRIDFLTFETHASENKQFVYTKFVN